jgi:hypothetical protein
LEFCQTVKSIDHSNQDFVKTIATLARLLPITYETVKKKEITMRKNRLFLVMVTILALGLSSIAMAQMMGGNHGNMPMGQNATQSQSATMNKEQMKGTVPPSDSLVNQMSQSWRTMSGDFSKLESHFQQMMKIQDMKELKAEMQKHYNMMQSMHSFMSNQEGMYQNMTSMMSSTHSPGMHAMKTTDSTQSAAAGRHTH